MTTLLESFPDPHSALHDPFKPLTNFPQPPPPAAVRHSTPTRPREHANVLKPTTKPSAFPLPTRIRRQAVGFSRNQECITLRTRRDGIWTLRCCAFVSSHLGYK